MAPTRRRAIYSFRIINLGLDARLAPPDATDSVRPRGRQRKIPMVNTAISTLEHDSVGRIFAGTVEQAELDRIGPHTKPAARRAPQSPVLDRESLFAEFQPLVRRLIRQYGEDAEM